MLNVLGIIKEGGIWLFEIVLFSILIFPAIVGICYLLQVNVSIVKILGLTFCSVYLISAGLEFIFSFMGN